MKEKILNHQQATAKAQQQRSCSQMIIGDSAMINLVSIADQKAITTSLIVAEAFDKQHKDILQSISQVECSEEFRRLNFQPSSYINEQSKMVPFFNITRDGFTFLAMGFTGRKAVEFKERFMSAFNTMERMLIEGKGERKKSENNPPCRTVSPEALNIYYTLDLAKVITDPTPKRLAILGRLTGIDFDDLAELPDGHCLTLTQARRQREINAFLDECCVVESDGRESASDLYRAYLAWQQQDEKPPASQKVFGGMLTVSGFHRVKSAGIKIYQGLRLQG